ncbi:MAG TPA: NADPH:quinone oxidoreductase family protein [Micromonosporaceae bacterium]|jgi:NADPH2:quinone reductase|nr:NADPH:quinone oxidoreductase family protein [Micromonosporaceae bacterium]
MRAWQVTALGEPVDVMRLASDVATPEPGAGQVLVKVHAVALNFPDVLMCRGLYQVRPPLPFTPGVELCGTVVAVGPDVTSPAVGDRVLGSPIGGGLAEFALMSAADALPAPDALDDTRAAAFHIAYQTGWFGLHRRAALTAGETLLVHAAAGGVGSAAVQLGKAAGARVIGVVGGSAKAAVATDLGAHVVIDRRTDDIVAAVKGATGGRGADVIYDPVGGDAFAKSTKCIAFEGRLLVIGFASGDIPSAVTSHALVKNYSVVGLHWGLYKQYDPKSIVDAHEALSTLAANGVAVPLVSAVLPFDAAPEGLASLAAGETTGRVVISVAE